MLRFLQIFFAFFACFFASIAHAGDPTITGTTINSANSELTVTFSEDVFNTTGGSGNLEVGDFALSISGGVRNNWFCYANVNCEDLPDGLGSGLQHVGHSQWL